MRRGRRLDVLAGLVPVVVLIIVFAPVLFGGRTLSGASYGVGTNGFRPFPGQVTVGEPNLFRLDVAAGNWAFEPWAEINSRVYDDGQLPLWNPYQGAGKPQAANMQSAPFDPLLAVVNWHPTPLAWDLSTFAAFLIGAVSLFAFGRVIGLGRLGAVAASVAFSLSGAFFLYSNNHFVVVYVYLPVLCLLVEWVVRSGRFLAAMALVLVTAACIAVGFPEGILAVVFTAGAWALWRCFVGERARSPMRTVLLTGGALALGGLIAAPLLFSFVQFEGLAFTAHKSGDQVGERFDDVQFVLNWLFPFLEGSPVNSLATGGFSGTVEWVGVGTAVAALFGLAARTEVMRRYGLFFAIFGAVIVAKVYGFAVVSLLGRLPVFELLNFNRFWPPAGAFAVAVVAGCGVDAIARRQVSFLRLGIAAAVAVAGFAYLVVRNQDLIDALPSGQVLRQMLLGVVVAAIIAAAALVVLLVRAVPAWIGAVVVVGAIAVELVVLAPNPTEYAGRADPFVPPAFAVQLRDRLATEPTDRIFGLTSLLFPETAGALGFYDIRMLDALYVQRYYDYIRLFVEPQVVNHFSGGMFGVDEEKTPAHYSQNPMFDLLGVRYLVTRQPLDQIPSPDAALPQTQWKARQQVDDVLILENTDADPRAFVVTDVDVVKDVDAAKTAFAAASQPYSDGALHVTGLDPRRTAVVEADPGQIPTALTDGSPCAGAPTARIEGYEADAVHIAVDSPCPGLLVLSDTYYPGWTATVNGKTTPIHPTDIALRGVVVPAGHSEVTMTFAPTTFRHGVIVSILALLVLPVIALGRRLLVRRPAVPTEELDGEERDVDGDLDDGSGPGPGHEPGGPAP